jgi:hypothetical protein
LAQAEIKRMQDQLFFEGAERNRWPSRYWLLVPCQNSRIAADLALRAR